MDAFNDHFYRTMVTSKDVGMDGSRLKMFLQSVGYKEIVNTPPRVLLSGTEAVGPPRVGFFQVRIEISEGICKSTLQQKGHLVAFFIGKTCIATIGLGVLEVYFLMGYIHVPTDNDRFDGIQLQYILSEVILPTHAVVQTSQFVL